jgi:hypothetical protein
LRVALQLVNPGLQSSSFIFPLLRYLHLLLHLAHQLVPISRLRFTILSVIELLLKLSCLILVRLGSVHLRLHLVEHLFTVAVSVL